VKAAVCVCLLLAACTAPPTGVRVVTTAALAPSVRRSAAFYKRAHGYVTVSIAVVPASRVASAVLDGSDDVGISPRSGPADPSLVDRPLGALHVLTNGQSSAAAAAFIETLRR
jgi:hypothetical protein